MGRPSKMSNTVKVYLKYPFILIILLIVMDVFIFFTDKRSSIIVSFFIIIYIIITIICYFTFRSRSYQDMVRFAADYGQVQKRQLKELVIPYAILDEDTHLIWANDEFSSVIGYEKPAKRSISNLFPEIKKETLPKTQNDVEIHLRFGEEYYKIILRRIVTPDFEEQDKWFTDVEENNSNVLIAMYLYNESENIFLRKENEEQRMLIGLLYIDNYDEALDSIDEVRCSLLMALVDRKINKYMQSIDAVVKKLEKDKYIFVFQTKYLHQLLNNKFSILEEVRAINIGNDMSVTISIGLGVHKNSYEKGYEYARAAIDLALGRGGDQAVIKEGEKYQYYGGKSASVEKSTRVKSRVKAHALKEFIEGRDKILVMGHAIADIDSFGSAVGIYRIAKTLNKRAHIVIENVTSSIRPMLNRFINSPEYEENMIVNNTQALQMIDANTLLVVVDVNRPKMTECPELFKFAQSVVVLDHHRQTGEAIENATLSYIEPYASSACEMTAEIMQYIGEGLRLRQVEADAMYAGMMIDTNNFLTKTGVRTFEAAAYLKRNGADITRIRKMFRTDMHIYMLQAEAIATTEIYREHYAFAECTSRDVASPTVLAAQAANELLNIDSIKGSFVFTEHNGKIHISARSIDELNVQVIMEKLGGGGHMSAAGAQLTGCTIREAKSKVKEVLDTML